MTKIKDVVRSFLTVCLVVLGHAAEAGDAQRLRVEHATTPLAVTAAAPRFSWYLPGGVATRGVAFTQTVEVSDQPDFSTLTWSSAPSTANLVRYAGPTL